jgi:hypothetical protein
VTSTYPMTTYVNTCTGTLVTNSDGTRSCVTQVGTSSLGYPIYAVSHQTTINNYQNNFLILANAHLQNHFSF